MTDRVDALSVRRQRKAERDRIRREKSIREDLVWRARQAPFNAAVLALSRPCPYPEWMLLELPNGMWAAFWSQGFNSSYCESIANGRYREVCSYRSRVKERVLAHMAKHLLQR